MRSIDPQQVTALLDQLLTCSMAEAGRRVGIKSTGTPWRWLVQSKLGHPELQDIEFCGVVAPFHIHFSTNVPALTAHQVQQSAMERARDGVQVDVFFQGQRMYETVLRPEYEGKTDDELMFEVGEDFKTICYETKPTKQWLKPSDALVVKMLESWNRKRYGAHQTVDVNYGGVLRLDKDQTKKPEQVVDAVFEEVADEEEGPRGGHLALAAPAKTSEEFEERAASGEFDPAVVTFKDASGQPAALRPDIEELRAQAAELRRNGPAHPKPEGKVEIFKADDEPEGPKLAPQTILDHPRAYSVPKPNPPAPRPAYSKSERDVGSGREGIGRGPDPERIGPHQGFSVTQGR